MKPIIFSSAGGMLNTLKRGSGVAICPEPLVRKDLQNGSLVQLHWEPAPSETTVFMIRHMDKWCSPSVSRFMELTESIVSPHFSQS